MSTFMAKPEDVERKWYVIDATDATLGRLATEVANILRGKKLIQAIMSSSSMLTRLS